MFFSVSFTLFDVSTCFTIKSFWGWLLLTSIVQLNKSLHNVEKNSQVWNQIPVWVLFTTNNLHSELMNIENPFFLHFIVELVWLNEILYLEYLALRQAHGKS